MKNKIAVITTEFMVDYIRNAFTKMQLDCNYEIFIYKTFQDIPGIYRQIPEEITGILTSGSFPARVIQLSFPNSQRVIVPFNTDDAAICQLFFRLLDENRFLKFERIYADLVEMFGIDLKTYLMHDFSTPLSITTNQVVCEKGLEELFQIEEQEYQKHLKLWQSGTIDLCVTRFSSIVERLMEQGVPVYFPFPSIGYMRDICIKLFKEIEYQKMKDNSPAIINVAVLNEDDVEQKGALEYCLLTLQASMMEVMGAGSGDYFIGRNAAGVEILTSRKNIEMLTENDTVCKIRSLLKGHVNFQIAVGYGIGQDLQQARMNAKWALEKSKKNRKGVSFLTREEDVMPKLLTPIQEETVDEIQWQARKAGAKKMVIPEYKIREVISYIDETEEKQITSQELAESLGITKRSANRILAAMEEQGAIEIVKTRLTSPKGRPERVYKAVEETAVE